MKKNYLNKKVEKIIEEVKKLRVVTYNEVLKEDEKEKPILDCYNVAIGVFIYNAGEDLFIIQDYYKGSIEKCNTPYLTAYLKKILVREVKKYGYN